MGAPVALGSLSRSHAVTESRVKSKSNLFTKARALQNKDINSDKSKREQTLLRFFFFF